MSVPRLRRTVAEDGVEGIAAVERHELVAQGVVGGMDAHRQRDGQAARGEGADAGGDTDGRQRDVPRR